MRLALTFEEKLYDQLLTPFSVPSSLRSPPPPNDRCNDYDENGDDDK